jgi:hypothetical protein
MSVKLMQPNWIKYEDSNHKFFAKITLQGIDVNKTLKHFESYSQSLFGSISELFNKLHINRMQVWIKLNIKFEVKTVKFHQYM